MYNIRLAGLDTGRQYYVKVRAKVLGYETSEWTPPFKFSTPRDTMPPGPVGFLRFVSEGDSFLTNWAAPTVNADGSPCADVAYYNVKLENLDTGKVARDRSVDPSYPIDLNKNASLFGTLAGKIEITITAVDLSGNEGIGVSAIAQNPPPSKVQNVTTSVGVESVGLKWDENTESDLANYEIHVGSASGFTPSQSTLRAKVAAGTNTHTYDTASLTTLYFKIIAVDKFNQKSIPSNVVSAQPRLTTDFDKTPPGVVAGVTVTQSLAPDNANAVAKISYTGLTDADLDKYEVQYRKTGETIAPWSFTSIPSDQTSAEIKPLPLSTSYDFRIRAVDFNSNKGDWSAVVVAPGVKKTTLPAAPTSVEASGGLTNLMVTWTESIDPSMTNWSGTYEVQASKQTDFSSAIIVKASGTLASFINLDADTVYYVRVRSIDPYLNIGPWSTTVNGNTGSVADPNASRVIWSVTPPLDGKINDLWMKLPENTSYRFDGTEWIKSQDIGIEAIDSKGSDLVINGNGSMGSNYNFSGFSYVTNDAPAAAFGSFRKIGYSSLTTDQILAVDPSKVYQMSLFVKRENAAIRSGGYFGLEPYDNAGQGIRPQDYMFQANTTTTLAAPLNPGDTTIKLANASNWRGSSSLPAGSNTHMRGVILWNYVDPHGKEWPELTYSKNSYLNLWDDGGVDPATNTITLRSPWSGASAPSGTTVSNSSSGGTYLYMSQIGSVPSEWTQYTDTIAEPMPQATSASGRGGASMSTGLPPGTAGVKLVFLPNHPSFSDPGAATLISNVSFSDATAAYNAAHTALNSANARNRNIYSVNPATGVSLNGYAFINGDTWYRRDESNTIIGMWEFQAGTWQPKTLNNQVIANLDAGKITSGFIDADRIQAQTITSDKIGANEILVGNMAPNSVDRTVIKDGEIITSKIAAEAITATKISADAVLAEHIKAGEIEGSHLKANTALINDLSIRSSLTIDSASGHIKSSNYNANGSAGFYMDQQQLIINQGKIKAAAIELQDSQNLLPSIYAGLNHSPKIYDEIAYSDDGAVIHYWPNAGRAFNGALGHDGVNTTVMLAPTATSHYIHLEAGQKYIVSGYLRSAGSETGSASASLGLFHSDPRTEESGTVWSQIATATSQTEHVRVQFVFAPTSDVICAIMLKNNGPGTAAPVWSCFQVERVVAASEQASPWTPPGSTSIEGESIVTGSISSRDTISTANGDIALWSIDTWGKARFADATIDGKLIVGGRVGADNINTYIQSDNYSVGNSGWAIKGNGDVEFNDGTFRGMLNLGTMVGESLRPTMTASVSNIKLYTDPVTFRDIDVASIQGTTYAYVRQETTDESGIYLPQNPDPLKAARYFIGPTTDRSVNIQVHDGPEDRAVYLDEAPDNVTLTSVKFGELTNTSSAPLEREKQGFGYSTQRSESDPTVEGRKSKIKIDQDSSVRLRSSFYPEISGGNEYPDSTHTLRSSVDFKAPTKKNLISPVQALPGASSPNSVYRENNQSFSIRAYPMSNKYTKSTYLNLTTASGNRPVPGKKHIFSAYVDTYDATQPVALFLFANNDPMKPLTEGVLEAGQTEYQHVNRLADPDYRYEFKVASSSYVNVGSNSAPLTRTQGSVYSGSNGAIYNNGNTRYTASETYNMNIGMTLSLWMQPSSLSGAAQVLFHRAADTTREIWINYEPNLRTFSGGLLAGGTFTWAAPNNLIDSNVWNHVVFVIPRTTSTTRNLSIYVNGELSWTSPNITTSQFNSTFGTQPYYLFGNMQANSFYNGAMAEATIYRRNLTGSQINGLYNSGVAVFRAGGKENLSQNGILIQPGGEERVAFEYTPTSTDNIEITMQVVAEAKDMSAYLYKLQFEHAKYIDDESLPPTIREMVAPTPWTTDGSSATGTAELTIKATPSPDTDSWISGSMVTAHTPVDSRLKALDRPAPAYMELALGSSYKSNINATQESSATTNYKWTTAGFAYPGVSAPFMPTALSIAWDYNNLTSTSRPQIGGASNMMAVINAPGTTHGEINLGLGSIVKDNFDRPDMTGGIGGQWVNIGQPQASIFDKYIRRRKNEDAQLLGITTRYVQNLQPLDGSDQELSLDLSESTDLFNRWPVNGSFLLSLDPATESRVEFRVIDWDPQRIQVFVVINGSIVWTTTSNFSGGRIQNWNGFKFTRLGRTLSVRRQNTVVFSVTVPPSIEMPTGRHFGFHLDNGRMDSFSAYDKIAGSTAYGMLLPESVNANNNRGITVKTNGTINVDTPGYYMVSATIEGDTMGLNDGRDYWIELHNSFSGVDRRYKLGGQHNSTTAIPHISGTYLCFLQGNVQLVAATNTTTVGRIRTAGLNIVRVL